MNLIRKIFAAFVVVFLFLPNVTLAAPQEISAEGEYRLGDRDSREIAKMAALADAKRKIIEQVGVYVESYSEMNKSNLTQDQIRTAANAMIKVKHEEVHYYENGTICRAFVVATADTDNIGKYINLPADTNNNSANNSNSDKNYLKKLGIEEFKGHYYKVFNDGMTWQDAKKTCEDMGGHLVTITSILEQEIVKKLVVAEGTKGYYWMGGFRNENDNLEWITGEGFSYSNWAYGDPNNEGGIENAVAVCHHQSLEGRWFDISEFGNNTGFYVIANSGFICEWDSYDDIKI